MGGQRLVLASWGSSLTRDMAPPTDNLEIMILEKGGIALIRRGSARKAQIGSELVELFGYSNGRKWKVVHIV